MKRRNETIDLLKTIFIFFVIITHSTWPNEGVHNMIAPILDFAVPGFLFISGYLYTKKYMCNEIKGVKVFANRFIRFFVPFIIAYIIEILLLKLSGYLHISSIELTPQYILKGFFLGGYGPGSYYYFIMIQFIIIIPIMQSIIKEYREKGLLIFFVANLLYEFIKYAIAMSESVYRLLVFRYLFIISIGIYFAFGYELKTIYKNICVFVGGVYIVLVDYFGLIIKPFNYWQSTSMIACMFYGIIISNY